MSTADANLAEVVANAQYKLAFDQLVANWQAEQRDCAPFAQARVTITTHFSTVAGKFTHATVRASPEEFYRELAQASKQIIDEVREGQRAKLASFLPLIFLGPHATI